MNSTIPAGSPASNQAAGQPTKLPWRTNGSVITAKGDWKLTLATCSSKQDVRPVADAAAETLAEARETAAFIVRACNSFEAMVAALEFSMKAHGSACDRYRAEQIDAREKGDGAMEEVYSELLEQAMAARDQACSAIALAKGGNA